ncbi:MAG: hypothetical protein AAGC71_06230 [Pseudomonadota bacterium]
MTIRQRPLLAATLAALSTITAHAAGTDVLIATGLGGEAAYASEFAVTADAIRAAVESLPGEPRVTELRDAAATKDAFADYFEALTEPDLLYVFLVGHGSFDDTVYKFNIPGPDITAPELADWLNEAAGGRQLVVLTGSASGAAVDALQQDNRAVITATRSGSERHATRFGAEFAKALANEAADLDKNRRVSASEAFELTKRRVADSYTNDQQLATEHPVLSGDGADRILLARLDAVQADAADPELARLTAIRDSINAEIETLLATRDDTPEAVYRDTFTRLLIDLAEAEEAIELYRDTTR